MGLPPMQKSAFTWPSPSRRISSASAAVGSPAIVFVRFRTRIFSPKPQPGVGGDGWAFTMTGGSRAPGFGSGSPARNQRPHNVLRQSSRYSVRLPRPDMLGPVPALAHPRVPPAKTRAARTRSAAGTSARRSTASGVNGATAARRASRPTVFSATKAASKSSSSMTTRRIPASTVGSSPGRG